MKLTLNARRAALASFKSAALILPLAVASAVQAAAPAQTTWVNTETKAFIAPTRTPTRTLAATRLTELAAGSPTHVVVSLKLRNASKLAQLGRDVNDHHSPRFRKFLTPKQFLAEYAPTEAQVRAVVEHLRKNGFTNIRVAHNRLLISANGTAHAVKSSFNTTLVHFQKNDRDVFANTEPAQVPAHLGDTVLSVLGLQNVTKAHTMLQKGPRTLAKVKTQADGSGSETGHYTTEFPALYNVGDTPSGANTTVAIITQGGVTQATQDLNQFTSANNLAAVNVQAVQTGDPNGDYSDDSDGEVEWDLDSQSIVGAAGGAVNQLTFYMADNSASGNTGLTQAFNQAVSDNTAKVINVSLGWCEADANSDGTMAAEDQIFSTAVAQGQTFSVSTGDEGVYECNGRGMPDGSTYSISWPASSPNVIAVGGTTLFTDENNNYVNETVWNESVDSSGKLWASTGGFSSYEPLPSWQSSLSVSPAPSGRAVPDIAFDAAQGSGALIYSSGQVQQVGGTSLASPIFVGLYARLQSANSNSLGFPAAAIYSAVQSTPSLVHDVVSGNNGYQGYGYNAGPGWDYTTGWGSFDISQLAAYIQSNGGFGQ